MTRQEHIRDLMEEYARQRTENDLALERRRAEAEARDPEIARLRADNMRLAVSTAKLLCLNTTREERAAAAEQMKRGGLKNNAEIRARLKALGLPEDHLSMKYRCPVCRDTGLVGEAPSRFCTCFESRLHARLYEDGTMADEQTFEAFDLSVFPEENGQRSNMSAVRRCCESYADSLPAPAKPGILLFGEGGLGKTYLLNCVYTRAAAGDISAVRITAYRMFEAMRRKHFGEENDERGFDDLIRVPLLLIDDLGTEPMMRNITVEYLFLLLNERMAAGRCTFVCTNLTPAQLRERYGERVSSRMMDAKFWRLIPLTGQDIRLRKR